MGDIRSFNSEVNDVETLGCDMADVVPTIGCDALGERYEDDRAVFTSEDAFPCNLVTCVFLGRFKWTRNGAGNIFIVLRLVLCIELVTIKFTKSDEIFSSLSS